MENLLTSFNGGQTLLNFVSQFYFAYNFFFLKCILLENLASNAFIEFRLEKWRVRDEIFPVKTTSLDKINL